MKKITSLLFALVLAVLMSASAFAQNSHSVTLTLLDGTNNEPVGYATVSVTAKGATSPSKYTLTNEKGYAALDGLKNGTYTFKAEMMGYKPVSQEIVIKDGNVALGEIKLATDQELLDAASVSAVGAPVTIKKDTIEYNAAAFKTTENDVLEDLLKKLPGVEVGDDGSITVNGQSITRVYIDGKTFFMDDPQVATKNLPAKIINKVKVVEKKSDQAEFTGIDDGQEETVLDLSVQPGMMKGLMGNITAGIGHDLPAKGGSDQIQNLTQNYDDYRFQDNLFIGRFTEDTQIAILGNANNANAMGFGGGGGMGGGMMGGMMGGMGLSGGMGGMMGGGMAGGGITTSYMLGGNVGGNFFDDKMEASGNYMYNHSNTEGKSNQYQRNYLPDYDLVKNTTNFNNSSNNGHSVGLRIEHEFSKNTSIIFQPQLSFNYGNSSSLQLFDTKTDYLNGNPYANTNDGFSGSSSNTKSVSTSGMFMYRQRIVIPGRTLTVRLRYNLSNNKSDGFNQSLTNTYLGEFTNKQIVNQRNVQDSKTYSLNANATYTEPLGNHFYMEANYSYGWNLQDSNKKTFEVMPVDWTYDSDSHAYNPNNLKESEVPDYSNRIINESFNQSIGLNMLYQGDKLRAQVGASLRPQKTHNVTDQPSYKIDTTFTVYNWAPQAQIIWDATDNLNLRLNYRGNSSQPSISQLMPVPDNSNPLRVSLGNPSLAPYFSHNLNGDFRFNNRQKFSSVNIRFGAGLTQDPIVNAIITTNGVQHTLPFNGPDSWNGNINVMTNNPIFTSALTLSTNTSASTSRSNSYTGLNIDITKYYKDGNASNFNYPKFLADYDDIANSKDFALNSTQTFNATERLTLTYRAEDFDIRVGGSTRYQRTWYSIGDKSTTNTFRNNVNAEFTWNWDLTGLTFDTDFRYNWYNGFDNQTPEFLWNMEIEKLVFNQKATIAVRAYDILGQTKNFSVTDSNDYHTETLSNSLGRYIIVSFSWRFGSFGNRGGMMGGMGGGRGGRGGRGRGGMGGGMPMMF